MKFIVEVLDEFDGQLGLQDIYHSTYKEIHLMLKHRRELKKKKPPDLGLLGGKK